MKHASVFLLALTIILVAIVMPQILIATPSLIVERIDDNTAVVSVSEPVKGAGFAILGDAEVAVEPDFRADMPALIKKNKAGTSVGVYTKTPADGPIAVVTSAAGGDWTIINPVVFGANGKAFQPTILFTNPRGFHLAQNYPNPFNPSTEIRYELDENGQVDLAVYDVLGQRIATLVSGSKSAGAYTVKWNATNDAGNRVTSGVYFCRIKHAGASETRRMVLLK